MGFKDFESALKLIAGIETMPMIKKGQLGCSKATVVSDADRFYSLATRWADRFSGLLPPRAYCDREQSPARGAPRAPSASFFARFEAAA